MKKVIVLNGSLSEIPLIEEAKKLGYYVITSGNAPQLIGHQYADEYIPADYSNREQILKIVRENDINGIISCANDFGAITASYVAEKMGWRGHDTYENTVLLHQKDRFKKLFAENGIPSPLSIAFTDQKEAEKYIEGAEYPIIIKAVDLTGGKGIRRADNRQEAIEAIEYAFKASREKHIVIEPFIEGHQESMVGFLVEKKVISCMSCNCYSPINPYLIQTEVMPGDYHEVVKDELCSIMEKLAEILDLADGIMTLQYIVKNGRPYVIELMRRCLGNQFLTPVTTVSGFPWHEALVKAELGMDCSSIKAGKAEAVFAGHHGIMAQKNGTLKKVTIPDEIKKHVYKQVELIPVGGKIENYLNERVGYIYYKYDNREQICKAAETFNQQIITEIEE